MGDPTILYSFMCLIINLIKRYFMYIIKRIFSCLYLFHLGRMTCEQSMNFAYAPHAFTSV